MLAGDGHQNEIRPLAPVGFGADHDRGTFLGRSLVGEGKRNQDDAAELVDHGSERLERVVHVVFGIVPDLREGGP
jgi:hypothetical protein